MSGRESHETRTRSAVRAWPLLIVLAGIATYANSLWGPFVHDDELAIVHNKDIRELWPSRESPHEHAYTPLSGRPVIRLSLAVNYALGGLDVRGYHAVNIAVHLLCALVLFGVVRRTMMGRKLGERFGGHATGLALAIALIWAVHPIQSECVNYVTQRTESLMALFYLLTFYCLIRGSDSVRRGWWYAAAVLCCALGMASKEVMVTAPLMVLLYDRVFESASFGAALRRRRGLYVGLAATWGILAVLNISAPRGDSVGFSHGVSALDYAANQCTIVVDYLRLVLWPHPLVFDYGFPVPQPISRVAPCAFILAALLAAISVSLVYRPMLGFLGVWLFAILAPTSTFIPIATEVGAARRMYLPLAGVVVFIVTMVHVWLQRVTKSQQSSGNAAAGPVARSVRAWGGTSLVTAAVVVLALVTARRTRDYCSEESIWRTAVEAIPHNPRAHNNLGNLLAAQGKHAEATKHFRQALRFRPPGTYNPRIWMTAKVHNNLGNALVSLDRPAEAINEYRQALDIDPDYAKAHANLGGALLASGQTEQAITHCRQALKTNPYLLEALYNLGAALIAQGELDEAINCYRRALQIKPDSADAHYNIGLALLELRSFDQAIMHLREAVKIEPEDAETRYQLAIALTTAGRADRAVEHLEEAIRLKPDWPAVLNHAAWILATHRAAAVRKPTEAVRLAERAAELTGHLDAAVLDTLAASYAAAGRFDQADATAQTALALATDAQAIDLAERIRSRLDLYRQRRPYQQP